MSEISIYQKPQLAVLEEKKKLRNYEESALNAGIKTLIFHLLNLLAVSEGKKDHHIKLAELIKAAYMQFTFEEIKHAFDLFVAGEFEQKPFQQLNAVVFGQVMRAYNNYKRNKLEAYRRKKRLIAEQNEKPSKEDQQKAMNDAVTRLYLEYTSSGRITGTISHIYDYLFTQGKLPKHDKAFKEMILEKAKTVAKSEQMTEAMKTVDARRALNKTIEKIEEGTFGGLKTISKRLVLVEYFEQLSKNKELRDISYKYNTNQIVENFKTK